MESQQLAKVRAEFETARREESHGAGAIVKGAVGNMSEFSMKEDWTRWFERLIHYFSGNDVPKEKQVSLFITLMGSEDYQLLCNLCTGKSSKSHIGTSCGNYAKAPATAVKCNIAAL